MGVFGQFTSSWKVGNLHHHLDYLHALGELKDLEFTLPTHKNTRWFHFKLEKHNNRNFTV